MEQIFIYDRYGLELLSCQFAGVSEEGMPQLVITTPGKVVESLDDYTCHKDGYLMLCGGEKMAESTDVMKLLGCVFEGGLDVLEDSVKGRVEDLKRFGIDWKRESVNLAAIDAEQQNSGQDHGPGCGIPGLNIKERADGCADRGKRLPSLFTAGPCQPKQAAQ